MKRWPRRAIEDGSLSADYADYADGAVARPLRRASRFRNALLHPGPKLLIAIMSHARVAHALSNGRATAPSA